MTSWPTALITRNNLLKPRNAAKADLAANLGTGATSVTVGAGQGTRFQVGETFVIDTEAFLITAIAADTLTVTPGYDGSSTATHTAGPNKLQDNPLAAHHNVPADELFAVLQWLTQFAWKNAVKAATTGNITLSGAQTIDGVSIVAGDRVLVKSQTTGSENGIYVAASGAWTRSIDANAASTLVSGCFIPVAAGGATNGLSLWQHTTTGAYTVGTDALTFGRFSGAQSTNPWVNVTSTGPTQMMSNTGYLADNTGRVDLLLPANPAVGDIVRIQGKSGTAAPGWRVTQNAGQTIRINLDEATSVGTAGYLEPAEDPLDSVALICTVSPTTWGILEGPQGNLNLV